MNTFGHLYTIAAEKPFLQSLATWVIERYGQEELLPLVLILLPNRRACMALKETFLACGDGRPMLLPRIQPIGDLEGDLAVTYGAAATDIPPAIDPIRRHLLLTKLVAQFEGISFSTPLNLHHATQLATQLASLLDDVAREGLTFENLAKVVPDHLANHWQQTLDFLTIISRHWPLVLEEEAVLDPVDHRNRVLQYIAKSWEQFPPSYPVIAAGSTGSQPATAKLLKVIACMPKGRVILPGLDTDMPEQEWELLTPTHPQYALKSLLTVWGYKRNQVAKLESVEISARNQCLQVAFCPPEKTAMWQEQLLPFKEGLQHVKIVAAETLLDEARTIAIALRQALEIPGKTAAVVTTDRSLARMIIAQMQRFDVQVDDSAGMPLMDTPAGCFLRLAIDAAMSDAAPFDLLALLRHPFTAAGMEPAQCRALSRQLELHLLRGIRRSGGIKGLSEAAYPYPQLQPWLSALAQHMNPLAALMEKGVAPLSSWIKAHLAFAEWLATTPDTPGTSKLWAGQVGEQLAAAFAGLLDHADILPPVDGAHYPELLFELLASATYRPAYGLHPRLHILSPIEARLQHYDLVILAGLNESSWPPMPEADPWMSRPMRQAFGLPAIEMAVGQSAHDFYMLAMAPEVLLTRARKIDGSPTIPSRWLVRLETLIANLALDTWQQMQVQEYFHAGRLLLDEPIPLPAIGKPAPMPPREARPKQLSVTAIDTLLRDPYAIYSRYILRLKPLNPLDQNPDAADFGRLVHKALEQFVRNHPSILSVDAYEQLLACGKEAFHQLADRPAMASIWWPRFEGIARWIVDQEKIHRSQATHIFAELEGKWSFEIAGQDFTLTTRIDRLEITRESMINLIDYKTGSLPEGADVKRGLANQLPLEALIVQNGILSPPVPVPGNGFRLEYWKLSGNAKLCDIMPIKADLAQAQDRLQETLTRFSNPKTPYTANSDPTLDIRHNDYEHLIRRQEWESV